MIDELVMEYLALSDKIRNGYKNSLGSASPEWDDILSKMMSAVPEVYRAIYGNVAGTYRNIENQRFTK